MCDRTNYLLSVYALISSITLMLSGVWIFLAMGTLAQEDMFKDRAEITKKLQTLPTTTSNSFQYRDRADLKLRWV